jgi:hypothetical protein
VASVLAGVILVGGHGDSIGVLVAPRNRLGALGTHRRDDASCLLVRWQADAWYPACSLDTPVQSDYFETRE